MHHEKAFKKDKKRARKIILKTAAKNQLTLYETEMLCFAVRSLSNNILCKLIVNKSMI